MKRDKVGKVAREAFEQLVKDVEAGKSDTLRAYLKTMGRFHRYSVGNAILIHRQRPDAMILRMPWPFLVCIGLTECFLVSATH